MSAIAISKPSSANQPLWAVLCLFIGITTSYVFWISQQGEVTGGEWRTFSGLLAAISATMAGFLATIAAVLYAVMQTPLMIFLQKTGHDRRILFDLFLGIAAWLASLSFSLIAYIPGEPISPAILSMGSLALSCSGILWFLPLGINFWMILTNAGNPGASSTGHDWEAPTRLD